MFVDEVNIFVRAGRGGDGMVHFHREKYVAHGGPDGGDGGHGGNVVLEVSPHLNTLVNFHYKSRFQAEDGKRGGPNNMSGRNARDLVLRVPPGTLVYDQQDQALVCDLTRRGETFIIAKGGRGGRGNQHFATASNQVPRMGEKGEPGEEKHLRLELKLIADVGIVGLPNAGKSSFLAAVTNATPKIADYPFTTLQPNLGVAELDMERTLILADIPGLVEGAHRGVGLGDAFLRHIQRTRVLIHLLDGSAKDPLSDFAQINSEMALFDPNLVRKPQIVVINKTDLPETQENLSKAQRELREHGYEPMLISALTRAGVREVLWKALELLSATPEPEPVVEDVPVYRLEEDPRHFEISRDNLTWVITSKALERAAAMTYWEHEGSARRFQKLISSLGVDKALREAGIKEGDMVRIADIELEWTD